MAQGRGVQLEWAIVFESLMRAGTPIAEIQARAAKHSNLKEYTGTVGAQAKQCVDLVQKKDASLLAGAFHSDELGIEGDPEPKTDVVFQKNGKNTVRCSVKMKGPIQLSSAEGPSTARAMAATAAMCPGRRGQNLAKLIEDISKTPTKLLTERNLAKATERKPNQVKELVDASGRIKDDKNYKIWLANNKPKLIKDLFDYLEEDPAFLYCLIEETLTGKNYFKNNTNAVSNYMLSPSFFGQIDDAYIKKMVKKTKIDIRAKSRDGISSVAFRFDVRQ
ncbi:hypothetical protein BJD43_gp064 [Cyanophage S-RIM50]|uniref:Uncharacterized protein n=1 Tax=Cyanophage S-RIM50 TaxID=687803 RepID=A0A127KM14_9CAUD|nr:hypothetical protein BJD43_gp064 [Cyanophage S-RIM50]AMO42966.1 hypothetical protein R290704_184 [Cyanophage S-RIM50]